MTINRSPDDAGGNGFLATLPAELQKEPSLQTFKDVGALAKSHVEAQKLIGARRVAVPGDSATEAELSAFYNHIGRPETADKYDSVELKDDKGTVIMRPDEKEVAKLKEFYHKLGLTKRQANQIMEYSLKYVHGGKQAQDAAATAAADANVAALRADWGDKFGPNVDIARSVIKKFGDEETLKFLNDSSLGNNAQLVKFLHKVGISIMEDTGNRGGDNSLPLNDTTRAIQEIENLKIDVEFQKALGSAHHPGHQAAVNRWTRLFAAAHPGQVEA